MPSTLPPLEPGPSEPVRRKKKKPKLPTAEADENIETQDPTQQPENLETSPNDDVTAGVPKPKKKKRRPKPPPAQENEENADQNNENPENVPGNTGQPTEESNAKPVTKKRRKRPKQAEKPSEDAEFTSELPEEFEGLQDDFIEPNTRSAENLETDRSNEQLVKPNPNKTSTSRRVFVETRSGFSATGSRKTMAFEATDPNNEELESFEGSTVKAAVWTQMFFHSFGVFLYGLTAGLSLMQAILVMVIIDHNQSEFVKIYEQVGLPFLCLFYLLITLCLVTTLDKWDLEKPRNGYFRNIVTCNSGLFGSVVYVIALCLSCVIATYEDKIQLSNDFPNLWFGNYTLAFIKEGEDDTYKANLTEISTVHQFQGSSDLDVFKYLVIVRTVFLVLAWMYVSVQPQTDELVENLKEMEMGYNEEQNKSLVVS